MTKHCTKCRKFKDISLFSRNKTTKDGVSLWCKPCKKISDDNWRKRNQDLVNMISMEWRRKNPEKRGIVQANYAKKNPEKRNAKEAKRRASKTNATPKWLSILQLKTIEQFYKQAVDITAITNIAHEVDHIIPLINKNVSGLHVPWNLRVITAKANRMKSNKLIEL